MIRSDADGNQHSSNCTSNIQQPLAVSWRLKQVNNSLVKHVSQLISTIHHTCTHIQLLTAMFHVKRQSVVLPKFTKYWRFTEETPSRHSTNSLWEMTLSNWHCYQHTEKWVWLSNFCQNFDIGTRKRLGRMSKHWLNMKMAGLPAARSEISGPNF